MTLDRRHAVRLPIQLWVEESHDQARYFQHSSNLSSGGIFLEKTIPHPVGTRVSLQFTLPGDAEPIRVRAEIVSAVDAGESFGMGMRWIEAPPELISRIERFLAERGAH
jgi:uncharacterized protein (TIGR02266 family)